VKTVKAFIGLSIRVKMIDLPTCKTPIFSLFSRSTSAVTRPTKKFN